MNRETDPGTRTKRKTPRAGANHKTATRGAKLRETQGLGDSGKSRNKREGNNMLETLYMIRTKVDARLLHEWMHGEDLVDQDTGMHHLLGSTFGAMAPKTFRMIGPRDDRMAKLYGYTETDAEELRAMSEATADPLQGMIIDTSAMMSKPMPREWKTGMTFGFDLRARPVRRVKTDNNREIESDIYRRGENAMGREETYATWLRGQMCRQEAASLLSVCVKHHRNTGATRKKEGGRVYGPEVIFQGTLAVGNPEAFGAMLARGIGRHKAYGYGMLLLKPPSKRD